MMQGAEFEYPLQSTTEMEMKAACVGSEQHFVWYHLGFSARRRDNQEMHRFFAELCYHVRSPKITVETCTILGRYLNLFYNPLGHCVGYLGILCNSIDPIELYIFLSVYPCLQKSLCAASEVVVHFVPKNPRFYTQANRTLCVERRGNKLNSSARDVCYCGHSRSLLAILICSMDRRLMTQLYCDEMD